MPRKCEEGFKFGCDPEFFLKDDKDQPVSAVGLLPGTKEEPYKVEGGAVQVDGMAAEINIDPVNNFEDWNGRIVSVMKQLKGMLPQGYGFIIEPSVHFSQTVLDATPDSAKVMGCDPDFNAWSGDVNPPPELNDPTLRVAGGHLHVGWTQDMSITDEYHIGHCRDLVKQLDWFVGGWSINLDKNEERRLLYGKAGAYRPKSYGVEYRTPSNFWLTSKERRLAVWDRMQHAVREMRRYEMPKRVPPGMNDILIEYINTGKGRELLEGCKYPLDTTLQDWARY